MTKVFISYSHTQVDWVWERLVPCLKAGGAQLLIDREQFKAGKRVLGQMDATQDQADRQLLILSEEYLRSDYCTHEMDRAIAADPNFDRGVVIPVIRDDCNLPESLTQPDPLRINLRDDKQAEQWTLLLDQCGANLGVMAPEWLAARDKIVRWLGRGVSVNLIVSGNVAWSGLLQHLHTDHFNSMPIINLESPATASRRGLLTEILRGVGQRQALPYPPEDLVEFDRLFPKSPVIVTLTHFDYANRRSNYEIDLFGALRNLIMDQRRLVLLVQSRAPFDTLLPRDHPLSEIDVRTIKLQSVV